MNRVRLFLFAFLWLVPTFTYAQPPSEYDIVVFAEERQSVTSSYLKDLEEQGYCVIPQILLTPETELLYQLSRIQSAEI